MRDEPDRVTDMFREAAEAAEAVARQDAFDADLKRIGAALRERSPNLVLTCARGSSDHAATYAKYAIETRIGVPVASAAPSVASVYASPLSVQGAACIAISQSGRSPDLLASVSNLKAGGAWVLALVNDEDSPLAEIADELFALGAGPERSVAATKSFIASLAAIARLVAAWSGDDVLHGDLSKLPSLLQRAWRLDWSPLVDELEGATNLYVLARGIGLGVAQEAALKLKETSQLHAEAFSTAELRHGPMALVHQEFPALIFNQSDAPEAASKRPPPRLSGAVPACSSRGDKRPALFHCQASPAHRCWSRSSRSSPSTARQMRSPWPADSIRTGLRTSPK